ncbi:hypothetical protein BH10ACI3_BH10ACI3_26470 [soil metagenome]
MLDFARTVVQKAGNSDTSAAIIVSVVKYVKSSQFYKSL